MSTSVAVSEDKEKKTDNRKNLMSVSIGISEEKRKNTVKVLSTILADEFVLYTKTRNAHYNVEGIDFHSKHVFFEEQYNLLEKFVDSVAERIRKLGHYAPATLTEYLEMTHLTENINRDNDSAGFIKELLEDHETIIKYIREQIEPIAEKYHDEGTSDFITGLIQEHEEMAWMLRASVKK